MEINKQLFEDVLSGKLKGTFVLRNGYNISYRNLTKHDDCDGEVIYPYYLDGYSYTPKGRWGTELTEKDIIDFMPDTDMEENKQWKQQPFTIELAKKIQSGEVEGRIVTNHGNVVTLVDAKYGFNEEYWIPIIWHWSTEQNQLVLYNSKGECKNSHSDCYLHIELPEEKKETPTHKFKPFDKVLVRDNKGEKWVPDIFRYYDDNANYDYPYRCCANDYRQCIPYKGNEHLLGTTNNPK